MDDGPKRSGNGYVEWLAGAVVLVLLILIFSGVQAQDAPAEQIRCDKASGWCLIREEQLLDISRTLAAMRDQLEQYAKLCRWGTR